MNLSITRRTPVTTQRPTVTDVADTNGSQTSAMDAFELKPVPLLKRDDAPVLPLRTRVAQAIVAAATKKNLVRAAKMTAAAAMLVALAGPDRAPASTVYVNVNGATARTQELVGARTAATRQREALDVVRPTELAAVLDRANKPDGKLRKLVVSGHSSGIYISGNDEQGSNNFDLDMLKELSKQYPVAVGRVQYFFAMACNVGTEENSRQWFDVLPNVKALVGFDHIAPASDRPAAGMVLNVVDAHLSRVDFRTLTRPQALELAKRISRLPGVNVTEFAIRLRTSDGSSVYYSKLNPQTPMAATLDMAEQLRISAFQPYFDAADEAHALPPRATTSDNPVRRYYDSRQNVLNAMGRDIRARGEDPANDPTYKTALEEKERAIRLMEYPVILQNAEHYKRPLINSVVTELASFGVTLNVPKLHTLTRTQVRALAKQIDEMGEYPLTNFAAKHQADVAVVSKYFAETNAADAVDFSEVTPAIYDWKKGNAIETLTKLAGNTAAPSGVRASAQHLATAMSVAPSKAFEELRDIFVEGLDKLEPEHIPFEWFTMARPNS